MNFDPLFILIYKHNKTAIELSYCLLQIAHLWDDLIDEDKKVSKLDINNAFVNALFVLPNNPLWDRDLNANLYNVYLRWQDANSIEQNKESTDNDLAMAWMLRASIYDMFVLIAEKLYGKEWARSIGPTVRAFYGEKLKDFIKEMRHVS
jgi:hypothetical protein